MNQKELIENGYQTLKSLNKNLRKNDLPQELLIGGIKNNGIWYPPDTIKKIKEYLKLPKSEKYRQTCIKKYGVKNVSQIDEIKNKKSETMLRNFGTDKSFELKQSKEAIRRKYGVDNISQNKDIKKKKINTTIKHFGTFGFNLPQIKKTIKEKYGVDNISQNEEIKKIKRKGLGKKYFYDNISFDSTWELALYFYLKYNNISFEYQPTDKTFTYKANGKKHNYFPDFKIGNQYIEIKGDHFFDKNNNFIDPFSKTKESKLIAEAKYDCMIQNNVIILREKDMKKYIDFATERLGNLYNFLRNKK